MADAGLSRGGTQGSTRSPANPLALAYFTLFAAFIALIAVIALTGKTSDGEPSVTLALTPQQGFPQQVVAPKTAGLRLVNGNLVADPSLIEKTASGPLPMIAADGRKPMAAYAGPFNGADTRPRIAVVIGGLGLSPGATKLALDHLPPAVTLSFAPYASDLQRWVDAARGRGHEVLIEVPMEPFDYPASDPGPKTLLIAAGEKDNAKRLFWILSRCTGYVGATNLLGGRFLSNANAIEPVLGELAKRGLMFFDNSASGLSAAAAAAQRVNVPLAAGAVVLDAEQRHESIGARLAELETRARENGAATASGIVYPVTIQAVTQWAAGVENRGFVLAPISAVIAQREAATEETTPPAE